MAKSYDVIIGGAGPVGLFLACELGLAGISVLVLERDTEMKTPWTVKPLGLRGLNTLSAEAFYRRGLLNDILDQDDEPFGSMFRQFTTKYAGHFAGIMIDSSKVEMSRWKYRLDGPSPLGGRTDINRLCTVLSGRAENLGVTISRGTAVTALSQTNDGVTVDADKQYYAKYLVGCDGGRSVIRKEAGFEFEGTDPTFVGYTAQVELDDPEKLKSGFQRTPRGMYLSMGQGHVAMMDFDDLQYDRTQEVTIDHFQAVLRRISGTDVSVTKVYVASTFTDRAKLAKNYRNGRIFLAGDSAHIHSPLGGQGLNAGVGDAMNLGWKLAAVVKGESPDSLLDTYNAERHPMGAWVTEWTRAQVSTLKPDPFGVATANLINDLINTTDGANYFVGRLRGFTQRYDLGDDHPLVGASVPDFEFVDGSRLGGEMRDGKALLIDFTKNKRLQDLVAGLEESLEYVDTQAKNQLGLDALLVRPDGIVAWVAEGEPDLKAAHAVIYKWTGIAGKMKAKAFTTSA